MRIEGLRVLDANDYDQITILSKKITVQRYNKNGRLVSTTEDLELAPSDHPISDEIRKLDIISTADRLVEYFLDYNKIIRIRRNVFVNGIPYNIAESPESKGNSMCPTKKLIFRTVPSKKTVKRILDKYSFDRDEFLVDLVDKVREFEFRFAEDESYYKVEEDSLGNRKAIFGLGVKKDQSCKYRLLPEELQFLDKALPIIMDNDLAHTSVEEEWDRFGFLVKTYMLVCGENHDRRIAIPRGIDSQIEDIASRHNEGVWKKRRKQEKVEGRVYQMKMEGF